MTITVSAMFIPVHDPDEALVFYRDALGLEVRNDVASDGFRWVTVGARDQDVDIVLFQPHGGRSQAEGDALLSLVTQGHCRPRSFAPTTSTRRSRRYGRRAPRYCRSPCHSRGARATARSATPRATSCGSRRRDRADSGLAEAARCDAIDERRVVGGIGALVPCRPGR